MAVADEFVAPHALDRRAELGIECLIQVGRYARRALTGDRSAQADCGNRCALPAAIVMGGVRLAVPRGTRRI
jgi:hypothetical protein